jgi:hypothetical protein
VQHEHPPVAPSVSQVAIYPMGTNLAFYPQFPLMTPYDDQPMLYMPPLQQLQYPVWNPHMGMWVQYPPMSMTTFHPCWGAPQRSVFNRLKLLVHDRLGPSQSGPEKGLVNTLIDQTGLMKIGCTLGLSTTSQLCHNHLRRKALPNLSKSLIPKPPSLLGLVQTYQFNRQWPPLTFSGS